VSIVVTFALDTEFAPWRKLRAFKRASVGEWDRWYEARVGAAEVRVVVTGVGRFAAQRSMAQAFAGEPAEACISAGLAGSLSSAYHLGEVLVTRAASNADGTHLMHSDEQLLARAASAGARVVERFIVSDHVVGTTREKELLAATGDAVDMESLYILSAAAHAKVPAVAIRSVSDGLESDLPLDFDRVFNERGEVSLPKVLRQLLANPGRLGGLLRLAHQSERAASALARFLDGYVQEITRGPLETIAKADAIAI
jgi:adenosylhomocysteine nucleosidase